MPKFRVRYTILDQRVMIIGARNAADAEDKLEAMWNDNVPEIYKADLIESEMTEVSVSPLRSKK